MATINSSVVRLLASLTLAVRLVVVAIWLVGCQTTAETMPDAVTIAFWQAMITGNLTKAQDHVTKDSYSSLVADQARKFSTVQVGAITLDGDSATVITWLTQNDKKISFNTALLKEGDTWKVDYQQTRMNISMIPFQGLVNELQNIGENFGEQLQQQVPLLEKGLQTFGDELKHQLEEFNRSLEKSAPHPKKSDRNTT